jgi:hypothetical protein
MKSSVRLLLFVALLLPFRGALAVSGWLCHTGMPSTASAAVHAHGHGHASPADASPDASRDGCAGMDGGPGQVGADTASCNQCSSICGAPAFPSGGSALAALTPQGATRFAPVEPPRAEFASGGLERPPRTV